MERDSFLYKASHSIVFGNPCIIKHNDRATEGYINRKI